VHQLGGYSAHADQKDLVSFATKMEKLPQEVRIVHGDEQAKLALQRLLQKELPRTKVWIPG